MQRTLKELRAGLDITQSEAAKRLNISIQTYNSWEKDFGKVKARDARRVAELFDTSIDDIFFIPLLESNSSKSMRKHKTKTKKIKDTG